MAVVFGFSIRHVNVLEQVHTLCQSDFTRVILSKVISCTAIENWSLEMERYTAYRICVGVSPIFVKSESYNILSFAEVSQNTEMEERMFTVSCLVGCFKAAPEGTPQDGLT